ncbi:MAG: hypothetical protein KC561_07450, partial [Myxococcales bacterium]|nr:hypothetical protein [Myxococcales bacterium]
YLQVFAIGDTKVDYDLEVSVDREFVCDDDRLESNDQPSTATFVPTDGDAVDEVFGGLTACDGDVDFFGIDLFAGQTVTATSSPAEPDAVVAMHLGRSNEAGTDLNPSGVVQGLAPDEGSNEREISSSLILQTDRHYLRLRSSDEVETAYSLSVETAIGAATCEPEGAEGLASSGENNDTAAGAYALDPEAYSRFLQPNQLNVLSGRICPAGYANDAVVDVDYFVVLTTSGAMSAGEGYVRASLCVAGPDGGCVFPDTASLRMRMHSYNPSTQALTALSTVGADNAEIVTTDTFSNEDLPIVVEVYSPIGSAPALGTGYELNLQYITGTCDDDDFEPNDTLGQTRDLDQNSNLIVANGHACGEDGNPDSISSSCNQEGVSCECVEVEDLFACPSDGDFYRLRFLAGDQFRIQVRFDDSDVAAGSEISLDGIGCGGATCQATRNGSTWNITGTARNNGSVVIPEYILEVDQAFSAVAAGHGYSVYVEVEGSDSRECLPDAWDGDFGEWQGANELNCQSEDCTLRIGGAAQELDGALCLWDLQDWFRYEHDGGDLSIANGFDELEGTARVIVFPDPLPEVGPITVYGGCTGSNDGTEACDCDTEFYGVDFDPVCTLPTTRPESTLRGREWVFHDLPEGDYQIRVWSSENGDPNPEYAISVEDEPCFDGVWSSNEECGTGHASECGGQPQSCSACVCD